MPVADVKGQRIINTRQEMLQCSIVGVKESPLAKAEKISRRGLCNFYSASYSCLVTSLKGPQTT